MVRQLTLMDLVNIETSLRERIDRLDRDKDNSTHKDFYTRKIVEVDATRVIIQEMIYNKKHNK